MKRLLRWCGFSGRGVAAVEFALTLPVLMAFLGAVTDFGIVYYVQSCLSTAVAAGAAYATTTYQNTGSVTAANIQTVMTGAAAQSLPTFTVTASATNPATCYCLTGSSPNSTLTSATCGSACTSGTATKYTQLTLTTTYSAILPAYSMLGGTTSLSESTWVPLQ